jgi:long-chain acyl-CoA synthetase
MIPFTIMKEGPPVVELPVPGKTFPDIFLKQVARYGKNRVALRCKINDKWKNYSWEDYFNNVALLAYGLLERGIQPLDKICLLSASCPEWLFIYLATQCLGAYLVPIYPNNTSEQARYITDHSQAKMLFVQNHDQLSKTENWRDRLDYLGQTVLMFDDPPGGVLKYGELLNMGVSSSPDLHTFLQQQVKALSGDSPAGIIYTSGTTGPPKGVILSQRNVVFEVSSLMTHYSDFYEEDIISFLPLSHIAEQMMTVYVGIAAACTVSFARSLETIREDLVEVRPTLFFSVPRLYEKVYSTVLETVSLSSFIRRFIFRWALNVGEIFRRHRNSKTMIPWIVRKRWALANRLVFSKLRRRLGMDRTRLFASGAAPLSADVSKFFGAMGMDIFEVFGQTECVGVCNATVPGKTIPGAIGPVIPGCKVALTSEGEIVVRGDNVFGGYWNDPETTGEALKEGWLYTGDIGFFDDQEYLHITDRKKDIIVTAGGKNVAPQNIESMLKLCTGVSQVVVIGDGRRYLTCLFTLDALALPGLCEQLGIERLSPQEACKHDAIVGKFQEYVNAVNRELASYETIKYFRILPEDFSVETGELTPTMKVKRRIVNEKYKQIIDSMYLTGNKNSTD